MKRAVPVVLILAIVAVLGVPMWSADKSSDDQTLRNAATVLQAMLSSKDIPASVIAKAIASSFCPA